MAVLSKKVFIAESAFLAFVDRGHPKHQQASAYFQYFAENSYYLYTGYPTVAETHRQIAEKISYSLARDFLRTIQLGTITILYPAESDFKAAIKTLVSFGSSQLKFVEAQMGVLAYRGNIDQIFTFEYVHPLFGQNAFYLPI